MMIKKKGTIQYKNCGIEYSVNSDKGVFAGSASLVFDCGSHVTRETIYATSTHKNLEKAEEAIIQASKQHIKSALDVGRFLPTEKDE